MNSKRSKSWVTALVLLALAAPRLAGATDDGAKADAHGLLDRARESLAAGALDEAERLARAAQAAEPTLVGASRVLGLAAFRSGRWEEARVAFTDDAQRQTGDQAAVAWFNLAGAEFKLGRFVDAEAHYLRAVDDVALAPLATFNAGNAADSDGRKEAARELWARAAALADKAEQHELAERARERLVDGAQSDQRRHRDEAWRLARAGSARVKAGSPAEAVAELRRSLVEARAGELPAGDVAELEYALGHALLDDHQAAEAVAAFRRAVEVSPRDGEFRYMLALALHRDGHDAEATREAEEAIKCGLPAGEEARARALLAECSPRRPRVIVDTQLSGGYDTNYAGGREAILSRGSTAPELTAGSPEIAADVDVRLRLAGTALTGLHVGNRFDALLYTNHDADRFSLLEDALYLEGSWSPRDWLTLGAVAEGYLQTAGITTFGLYQTGAQLGLRAVLLEGDYFATRLRYTHSFIRALDDQYAYMTGGRDEVVVTEAFYIRRYRLSLGYRLTVDEVGRQSAPASDILDAADEQTLRCQASAACLDEPTYTIPYSYVGNALALDGGGEVGGGVHLALGVRLERRDYLEDVTISPDPRTGYHKRRVDGRLSLDLAVKREIAWGVSARLSLFLLVSRSTIDNTASGFAFDFDNKNFYRFVGTIDLLKSF